jgi:aspartate-semialdehyde dehydrogenase
MSGLSIAVVGATGQVGQVMRSILLERKVPIERIRFFASSRSAGRVLDFNGLPVRVEAVDSGDLSGIDFALFSIGAPNSLVYAPRFAEAGALVIDNSSAFRMDEQVPLVVPEVNPDRAFESQKGIIANPNCTTMIAMPPLKVVRDLFGLRRIVAATYQAVSGAGRAGVAELGEQLQNDGLEQLTFDGNAISFSEPKVFPKVICSNVIPHAGSFDGDDTTEELKLINESRKILELPDLSVQATCVRVPVFTGHSIALSVECQTKVDIEELKRAIDAQPGCVYKNVPDPLSAAGKDDVEVGRIRRDPDREDCLSMFVSGDNLRKGAALNAVQILELVAGI